MLKSLVAVSLTLAAIAPVWSASAKAPVTAHPEEVIIYTLGNVRIHGALSGETIIYCKGNMRVHGIAKQGKTIVTVTKA